MISYATNGSCLGGRDLFPANCGSQNCAPSHSFGPSVRDHHLLHLITGGKGKFTIQGKTYELKEGNFFYIPPDTLNYYEADAKTPWSYSWVGMKGEILPAFFEKLGISAQNPVGTYTAEMLELATEINKSTDTSPEASLLSVGKCYLLLHRMEAVLSNPERDQKRPSEYVEMAMSIINKRLHKPVSVSGLAEEIGIDRSYLCSIFKRELDCSPQSYILEKKIEKAKYFLASTQENVKYIALSLGYEDQFVFSRAFKARTGYSPSDWRNIHRQGGK